MDIDLFQEHMAPYYAAIADRDRIKNEVLQPAVDQYNAAEAEGKRIYAELQDAWFK